MVGPPTQLRDATVSLLPATSKSHSWLCGIAHRIQTSPFPRIHLRRLCVAAIAGSLRPGRPSRCPLPFSAPGKAFSAARSLTVGLGLPTPWEAGASPAFLTRALPCLELVDLRRQLVERVERRCKKNNGMVQTPGISFDPRST